MYVSGATRGTHGDLKLIDWPTVKATYYNKIALRHKTVIIIPVVCLLCVDFWGKKTKIKSRRQIILLKECRESRQTATIQYLGKTPEVTLDFLCRKNTTRKSIKLCCVHVSNISNQPTSMSRSPVLSVKCQSGSH